MKDAGKTKKELLAEVAELRSRLSKFETPQLWPLRESTGGDGEENRRLEQTLRRAYAHFEKMVQERTAVLEKANAELLAESKERKKAEEALRAVVAITAGSVGRQFFENIVRGLGEWLGADCVIIGELAGAGEVNSLSMILDGELIKGYKYALKGAPCEKVIDQGFCHYPQGVTTLFPDDDELVRLNAEGYVGIPLLGEDDSLIGLISAVSRRYLELPSKAEEVLGIIAERAVVELKRARAEEELKESEERLIEAQRIAQLGSWELVIESGRLVQSADAFFAACVSPDAPEGGFEGFISSVHPDDRSVVRRAFGEALADRDTEQFSLEFRILQPDGMVHFVHERARIFRSADGAPVRVVGTTQDVTERKKYEDTLRLQSEMISHMREGVTLVSAKDAQIVYANRRMEDMFGYAPGELLGKPVTILNAPRQSDGKNATEKAGEIMAELEDKGFWTGELQNISKDGRIFWTHPNVTVFRSDHYGDVMLSVQEDITERKRAEEALRMSEEKYRSLFESSKDAVYIITPEGELIDFNPACLELFGLRSRDEMKSGVNIGDYYWDPADRKAYRQAIEADGFVKDFDLVLKKKDGTKLYVTSTASVVRNEKGEVVAYRGILHDMTERKLLAEQLKHAQKMEAVGELTGGIAHDFNNIMTIIKTFSNLAMKSSADGELQEYLDGIRSASDRAANLTRQLLILSSRLPTEPVPLNINSVTEDLLKVLGSVIGENITVDTDFTDGVWTVTADKGNMEQLVMNLVVNARDALPEGGKIVILTENVELGEDGAAAAGVTPGSYVRLSVQDNGRGMDADVVERVFEPFFTTKGAGQGTGLGLAVVANIIKTYSGFVNVESSPGEGSTFSIYLPARAGAVLEETAGVFSNPPSGRGERVLLVEDEKVLLMSIALVLKKNNYRVFQAQSAEEAFEIFKKEKGRFDLVISDTVLPNRSGLELVKDLLKRNPALRLLLTSGYMDIESQWPEIQGMGYSFLRKPYEPCELLAAVRDTMTGRDRPGGGIA